MRRDFGIRAGLVSNGVDPRRFRPPRDRAERAHARRLAGFGDRFTVLTVGGIEPRKGSITLLEGFARLRRSVPDALLVIAGGTTLFDYRHELERFAERADELGVTEHVWRLGALDCAELERLFRAADAFAFPSVKEGFGLAALEAVAAGLPLVVSDLDVFRGFLEHERSALLTPVGDGEALAAALTRVARESALRTRLRAGGRAVVARHTWEESARAHERAYERLAVTR
jgi:glycosyltransferase involved in cell wall biosynthesis